MSTAKEGGDEIPTRHVAWPQCVRMIRSIYPPIDLFEDIADPADWEALASAEAKMNPRLRDSIGTLAKVPVDRRVAGPGASYVMAQQWRLAAALHISNGYNLHGIISPITARRLQPAAPHV